MTLKADQIAQNLKEIKADKTHQDISTDVYLKAMAVNTHVIDINSDKEFIKITDPNDDKVIFDLVDRQYAVKDEDNNFTETNTFDGVTNFNNNVITHNVEPYKNNKCYLGSSSNKYKGLYVNYLFTNMYINGTKFEYVSGTGNSIITDKWGATRSVTISDSTCDNTSTPVSVNGSDDFNLILPDTIKANLSGNAETATFASNADHATFADSASKLDTSAGSKVNPIYVKNGKPVASTGNVGSSGCPVYLSNGKITQISLDDLKNALGLNNTGGNTSQPSEPVNIEPEPDPVTAPTGYYYYIGTSVSGGKLIDNTNAGSNSLLYTTYNNKTDTTATTNQECADECLTNSASAGTYFTDSNANRIANISSDTGTFKLYMQKAIKIEDTTPRTANSGYYYYFAASPVVTKNNTYLSENYGDKPSLYTHWTGKCSNHISNSNVDLCVKDVILTDMQPSGQYLATSDASIVSAYLSSNRTSNIYIIRNNAVVMGHIYTQAFIRVYSKVMTLKSVIKYEANNNNISGNHLFETYTKSGTYLSSVTGQKSGTWKCITSAIDTGGDISVYTGDGDMVSLVASIGATGGNSTSSSTYVRTWNIYQGTYVKIAE